MPAAFSRTMAVFGVLRDPELRALWFADWVSDVGNFITFIALAVYINQLTGSAAAVGFALALRSVPWFTIGPIAGVLADRMDRRAVTTWTNVARAILVGALPFTHVAWQAYVLSFASSVLTPVFRPARSALLAQVAGEERLVRALVVSETTHQVLHTVGPALGGLAVLGLGARRAFFLDAATFLAAAALIATVRTRGRPTGPVGSVTGDLREGVRAVLSTGEVRTWALLDSGLYAGGAGVTALLVVYLREQLHRSGGEFGLVLSVAGLGTVLASLVIAARDDHASRTPWAYISILGLGLYCLVWLRLPIVPLLFVALASGASDAGAGIPMSATIAEGLSDAVRGRAYGAIQAINEFGAAAGSLVFAWLGEPGRMGPANALGLAAAVGAILASLVLWLGGGRAIAGAERARLARRRAAQAEPGST